MSYRIEYDSLGSKEIPATVYYGIQTARGQENFNISGRRVHDEMIRSLVLVKKSAAIANYRAGMLDEVIAQAIEDACDEILAGKFKDQFVTDMIQGGAGTSMNMNVNEVIANRAGERLGSPLGTYELVHPNDHVNFGQSTNDVVPTAAKLTMLTLGKKLMYELTMLHSAYLDKGNHFSGVIKMGRTHLQDAVPIRLGQEFTAFASALERDMYRIHGALQELKITNMGATAVGTGLNANIDYIKHIVMILSELSEVEFKQAVDLVDSTRNLDAFLNLSSTLRTCAASMSKTANDLRLMASGPQTGFHEINLPQMQPGSSIMPGKVNPVIPEVVNQVAFQIMGNDVTILKAVEAGQLELNVFEPVMFANLFQSLEILTNAAKTFRERAIVGLTVNKEQCIEYVERSAGVVTALAPHIGYKLAAEIAKEAIHSNMSIRPLIIKRGILTEEELEIILNIENLTSPGIPGEQLLSKKQKH